MKRTVRLLIFVILLAAGVAGGWYYSRLQPAALEALRVRLGLVAAPAGAADLTASGVIEAQTVSVVSEVGGRLAELGADEGDETRAGQTVARLDTALLDAEIKKAQAALALAQAGVDLAQAGARPEAIAQAEAGVAVAQTAARGARRAWDDARAVRDAPQELDAQIVVAQSQVALAAGQARIAELAARAADMELAMYNRLVDALRGGVQVEIPVPGGGTRIITVPVGPEKMAAASSQANLAGQRTWQAHAALDEAKTAYAATLRNLESLQKERQRPLALDAQVHAAESAYREAEAAVPATQALVADLQAGARREDIAVAEAGVAEAQAAVQTLQAQRQKMTLAAPLAGLVTERNVSLGEIVAPGAALLKIANLDEVTLTVYIAEDQIGRVKVGQDVEVSVDSFPGRVFRGRVAHIASQAEYTPKNVQTKEERASMVFAVKVELTNPDHALKPGMPADARILAEGGAAL